MPGWVYPAVYAGCVGTSARVIPQCVGTSARVIPQVWENEARSDLQVWENEARSDLPNVGECARFCSECGRMCPFLYIWVREYEPSPLYMGLSRYPATRSGA